MIIEGSISLQEYFGRPISTENVDFANFLAHGFINFNYNNNIDSVIGVPTEFCKESGDIISFRMSLLNDRPLGQVIEEMIADAGDDIPFSWGLEIVAYPKYIGEETKYILRGLSLVPKF